MNVALRIATPDDAEIIHEVYQYYIDNSVATFSETNLSIEKRREEIQTLLLQYPFLIAEGEGSFLGFACAEPLRPQSGYRYCVELTIYLHPDAPKHSGVGKALYGTLLDILEKQGFRTAFGVISGTNTPSIALHERFGFAQAARFDRVGYKQGMWLDAVWMRKELGTADESPDLPIPFCEYRKRLSSPIVTF